jgi:hypothetical protein
MQGFRAWLLNIYHEYKDRGIGAADLVQVAGALAVRSCPGGPIVKTVSVLMALFACHDRMLMQRSSLPVVPTTGPPLRRRCSLLRLAKERIMSL